MYSINAFLTIITLGSLVSANSTPELPASNDKTNGLPAVVLQPDSVLPTTIPNDLLVPPTNLPTELPPLVTSIQSDSWTPLVPAAVPSTAADVLTTPLVPPVVPPIIVAVSSNPLVPTMLPSTPGAVETTPRVAEAVPSTPGAVVTTPRVDAAVPSTPVAVQTTPRVAEALPSTPGAVVTNLPATPLAPTTFVPRLTDLPAPSMAPTTFVPQTAPPVTGEVGGQSPTAPDEVPMHVQIIFKEEYSIFQQNATVADQSWFAKQIGSIAGGISENRVVDIVAVSQPVTDRFVLRFTLQPVSFAGNCASSICRMPTTEAIDHLRKGVYSPAGVKIHDTANHLFTTSIETNTNTTLVAWSDYGPCPNDVCPGSTPICNFAPDEKYYCIERPRGPQSPQLLYLLLLLLLIPIIILIVVVIYVICDRRKKKLAEEKRNKSKRMVRTDMLTYHEYTVREKELQPKYNATVASRSTINPDQINTLYRSLGANLSIAYNGSTFITDTNGTEAVDNKINMDIDSSSGVAMIPADD